MAEGLTLPLDYAAIGRILPHRYPFLLVDRIVAFEPDKRIVGVKNVSMNERYLSTAVHGDRPVLPPTILTEAVAQVGAILILSKPENKDRLIYFMGIERVRYRGLVYPGDVVEIEALVKRIRSRMGVLTGRARVGRKIVVHGTMTFALGPRSSNPSGPHSAPDTPQLAPGTRHRASASARDANSRELGRDLAQAATGREGGPVEE